MKLPGKSEIERASRIVHAAMQPTLQHTWPLLNQRLGVEVWSELLDARQSPPAERNGIAEEKSDQLVDFNEALTAWLLSLSKMPEDAPLPASHFPDERLELQLER